MIVREPREDVHKYVPSALELPGIDQRLGNMRRIARPLEAILPDARIEPSTHRNRRTQSHGSFFQQFDRA